MQRQTRPLSFHPRSVVGTVLSRRRELRSAGAPVTSSTSPRFQFRHAGIEEDFCKHTLYETLS